MFKHMTNWTIVKQDVDEQGNPIILFYTDVDVVNKPYI